MYHNLRKNGTDEVQIEKSRLRNMKVVDTREYVGMLKELTEEGKEVSMLVFGSSMAPFLIHARDMIYFKKPDRELQKGDIVFFRRKSGQFVMHRIWKIRPEGYYIVGDAQTQIEGPVKREQIFALITKVRRKVAGAGRFLVGILRACMAAYDSAPPGDYVVLCEGD